MTAEELSAALDYLKVLHDRQDYPKNAEDFEWVKTEIKKVLQEIQNSSLYISMQESISAN